MAKAGQSQCINLSVEGTDKCNLHHGPLAAWNAKKEVKRQYNITKWQGRIEGFSDHEGVKTLRDEIGILRLLMETTLNLCKDEHDLLLYSNKISDLVMKVESTVKSCHKLESAMGMLLDRAAALQFSGEIIEIIARRIPNDEELVQLIAADIAKSLVRIEQTQGEVDGS